MSPSSHRNIQQSDSTGSESRNFCPVDRRIVRWVLPFPWLGLSNEAKAAMALSEALTL
jgi:hypothetical protein